MTLAPLDRPAPSLQRSTIFSDITALPAASLFLSAVIVLATVNVFAKWQPAAFIATPFLFAYFAKVWKKLLVNGRILLVACAIIAAVAAVQPDGWAILGAGASRMIFLPAFIALLGLLRAAAGASSVISVAGRHLVNQPPARRYLALSFGGHFFGILLNIGGLGLLVEMLKSANTLEAAGGDPVIVSWRERRMTVAVLRGFAAMAFWTPLGVSFNLLLVSVPGATWGQVGPYGILCAAGYMGLGWVFDQFQRPKGLRARLAPSKSGGAMAVAMLVLHVALISLATWSVEYLLKISFQTALLIAVPAYSFLWAIGSRLKQSDPAPLRSATSIMVNRGLAAFPSYANEICIFAASGFLGATLVALVPEEALRTFFLSFSVPPGVFAGMLCVTVAILGFIGLNPMIAATILASAVASAHVPGLSNTALVLAIAAGWACTVVMGPMNSALVMTSAMIGRAPWEVSVKWNGRFALGVISSTIILSILLISR